MQWRELLEKLAALVGENRKFILFIVFVALLLDNMLLTTVVPIIPEYLYQLDNPRHAAGNFSRGRTTLGPERTTLTTVPIWAESELSNGDEDEDFLTTTLLPSTRRRLKTKSTAATTPGTTNATTLSPEDAELQHEELVEVNVRVGVMFASKAIMQLIANPFVGLLTNRIGYSIPMFTGFVVMFVSTIIFAFGGSYAVLFMARSIQGIGSACSSVSGMGMIAERFPEDRERGNAMAVALGGLAMGVLIGPPYGGVLYDFVGKSAPFLILAFLALFDGLLQLVVLKPAIIPAKEDPTSFKTLLKDPYILIAAGSITFANMGIAMLEPSLPIWMRETMRAPTWQTGTAFLPASISYLLGTNLFGPLGHRMGRWLAAMVGMIVVGFCLLAIPSARTVNHLIVPNAGIGFAIGMVDSSMMPIMGYLVDIRHTAVYGNVYAITDVAFCLGFAIGPALSGSIVKNAGFPAMMYGIGIVCLLYAPLLFKLRNPPGGEERQSLIPNDDCTVNYSKYTDLVDDYDGTEDGAVAGTGMLHQPSFPSGYYPNQTTYKHINQNGRDAGYSH
ncbi:synaptic vesicular amine transporter-like [Paramacrobiotus metropolitanus]|uniref:synaptic vesicular amine transporter-like n=1 Tax=Paramacrobiotus metropolitanus TaxID=2943436 RepID=UPI002445AA2E|nr:synaptic vesicular amine transporter-like [Paramacrobiotus metropolitanus]XP_055332603.1 synaptic vesicular amine transporter-like [Paramacrobiotus metropolitanus]